MLTSPVEIEPHDAAEEMLGRHAAEAEVRVGHRYLRALSVAHGPGIGAGALRADAERARRVEPADRAAPGPHGMNVDDGNAHRAAGHRRVGSHRYFAVAEADIGRRASHVESDDLVEARQARNLERPNHSGGRPREYRLDHLFPCARGRDRAAVGLHDPQADRAGKAFFERAEIRCHLRRDVGVDRRRAETLVLAVFRQHEVGGRDRNAGAFEDFGDKLLVFGIGVRMEKTKSDRIAGARAKGLDDLLDPFSPGPFLNRSIVKRALVNAEDVFPRH